MSFRITVTPNGQVITECDSATETAALVRELRNGKAPRRRRAPSKQKLEIESEDIPLSPALVETWNWLVKHDNPQGCHSRDVADGLGIKEHAVIYRLTKLVEKELAHRPQPGHFRAGG